MEGLHSDASLCGDADALAEGSMVVADDCSTWNVVQTLDVDVANPSNVNTQCLRSVTTKGGC